MTTASRMAISWVEQGLAPDTVIRQGIRRLLAGRLDEIGADQCDAGAEAAEALIQVMDASPVALITERANEQHYELPAAFFDQVPGERRNYSFCHWGDDITGLDRAEEHALALTCEHASLGDHQDILELGCGWGSLSLWMAEHYPASRITAVSNSHSQKAHIDTLKRFSVSECRSKLPVAADADGSIMNAVMPVFSQYASSTSYAIAPDGRIVYAYSSLSPSKHVANTLAAVEKWKNEQH